MQPLLEMTSRAPQLLALAVIFIAVRPGAGAAPLAAGRSGHRI
jgi:hypothetical protein